jgi:hypothetical protein
MQNRLIISLITAKIFFATLTFYFFAVYLGWDMFSYPDYHYAYSNCSEISPVNIFYSKMFCGISSITDRPITFDSVFFISAAAFINTFMLVEYFKVCEKYLNKYGKYLLIILFVIHPYMNIYFFRFYTDLFASLGIFLVFFYKIKNIDINIFFLISALVLINFRVALIPVFIAYSLWEIYSQYNPSNYRKLFYPILLLLFSLLSYIPVMEFSSSFASINSEENLLRKIIYNIVFAFGFRESFGISRVFIHVEHWTDMWSFIVSLILISIHALGLSGIMKFSLFKKDLSILIIFLYLLMPILAVAHMRYLLPLMPILLFGYTYLFFGTTKVEDISNADKVIN